MLNSSDAKFRCMWHMFVWSILLSLVSQFLDLRDHVAFYIFAAISVLVLPVLTAVYSNTSGRHGAGLVRAGYVFCDPVLACITVTPVLLLTHLPRLVDEYVCLKNHQSVNETLACMANNTEIQVLPTYDHELTTGERQHLIQDKRMKFNIIEASIGVPIVLVLLMGRRTRKMSINTFLLCFCYWLVTGIESADLVDTALLGEIYKHTIYTTEAIICIVMIITNSYAIVTLCSYISPSHQSSDSDHKYDKKFDFVYKVFVSAAGVFFAEIPLLVARFQILAADETHFLSATFYMWLTKDILFIGLIILSVLAQKFGKKAMKIPCRFAFDNTDIVFQPEKRDVYIVREKRVRFKDPPVTGYVAKSSSTGEPRKSSLKQNEKDYQNFKSSLSRSSMPPVTSEHSPSVKIAVENSAVVADSISNGSAFDPTRDDKDSEVSLILGADSASRYDTNGARLMEMPCKVGAYLDDSSGLSKDVSPC